MRRIMDILTIVTFAMVCLLSMKLVQSPQTVFAQQNTSPQYKIFHVPETTDQKAVEGIMNHGSEQGFHLVTVPNTYFPYIVFAR